jgi:alcohol dehydrogenase class IV
VLDIRTKLQIPHALSLIDIDEAKAELVGQMSAVDPSAGGNPIEFSAAQYSEIFLNAVKGQLD